VLDRKAIDARRKGEGRRPDLRYDHRPGLTAPPEGEIIMTKFGTCFRSARRRQALTALLLGAAMTAIGTPALAQSTPEALEQMAAEYIRGTGVARGATPAARWLEPVCPKVLGIREDAARAAERMIRRIAAEADAPVADEVCDSNIVVTFAPNPAALMHEIRDRSGARLAEVSPTERNELLNGNAPIRWWYTTKTMSREGTARSHGAGSAGQNTPATHTGSGAGSDFGGDIPTMMHYSSSTISTFTQRALHSASVVVDENAVVGMPLSAIAAYAALVSLSEIRSSDFAPSGSILGLFGGANAPRRLSAQDRSFLRALYRIPLDREASMHRGALVRDMVTASIAD
jgi:hypothetical protein